MKKYALILLLSTFSFFAASAQQKAPTGFWSIAKVSVGDRSMTPVARWNKINEDGTFSSGNGWLQSMKGTWSWNEELAQFKPTDKLGLDDPFGPFTVEMTDEGMTWTRMEEGMEVVVHMVPITELPMAPADYLEGKWVQTSPAIEGRPARLFFRWDRIVLLYAESGEKSSGYWHINGHRSNITILPHHSDQQALSWRIEVGENELVMVGISDDNRDEKLTYKRVRSF